MSDTNIRQIKSMAPQLLVADLNCSLAFYRQYLGFEESFCYEDLYVGLTNGVYHIHLKLGDPVPDRIAKGPEDPDLLFAVADIKPFFQMVRDIGANITQPSRSMPYGTEFYMADPDGHILAFIEENK